MSDNNKNNSVEDIIDLTEVVSIGSGVGVPSGSGADSAEDDVLDSLVTGFEEKNDVSGGVSAEDDNALDLSNLDSLISSYNLDFDEDKNQNSELDSDFDSLLNNFKNEDAGSGAEQDEISSDGQDQPAFSGQAGFSADAEDSAEDEIDLLTKDIIDGPDIDISAANQENELTDLDAALQMQLPAEEDDRISDTFLDELDTQLREQEKGGREDLSDEAGAEVPRDAAVTEQPQTDEEMLKSDMAEEEPDAISDEAFNDILNELTLEHENDEEVVSFAQEASVETMPIHLKGDINFLENNVPAKENNEDISLVQSASKVLDSDEAYLEKFSGEDESVGAKLKNLSTNIASLEQRLMGSDSKWQDTGLELNYRISGLETRISALEENTKSEIASLKSALTKYAAALDTISDKASSFGSDEHFLEKIHALENRIATLDDIFSEQKMLNDELAKTLDAQSPVPAGGFADVQALEEKVAALSKELYAAQAKIALLEENIEKAASLAAAKVLREEIIPLLTKA